MCGAQITTTRIVAPLGKFAIAANAFGVNAESLCYMPGYGVADAATTLVGQSIGAKRQDLAWRFASITVTMGVAVMSLMGLLMYIGAPLVMEIMSPVEEIVSLGASALRIEAFAEPMFAASIVCYGVFVGADDTLIPSGINLSAIWAIRITLAVVLAPVMGLNGVWLAMCIELNIRGILML
jgi:Na+-driven multidrug efflux pump